MRYLEKKDYVVSTWSGGVTVQLAIGPEEALYGDRDFLWRISSATVDLPESDFTALPDYDRLIAPIAGEMVLSHDGGPEISLKPCEVHAFDGASHTRSRGKCTDFNLMTRKGAAEGRMEALQVEGSDEASLPQEAGVTRLFYCVGGEALFCADNGSRKVYPGCSVLVTSGSGVRIKGLAKDTVFMLAEVREAGKR